MKIAICGAGLVGSYLYRRLSRAGFEHITVFEKYISRQTRCGINPCAWGASIGFKELIEDADLDPGRYILQTFTSMVINDMKLPAEAMVIDKPKLITDLLNGAQVLYSPVITSEFDRIIDATGFARAFLPAVSGKDVISSCVQYRVSSSETSELGIDVSNLGYAWRFPLSHNEYHIGAGSVIIPPGLMLEKLGWLGNSTQICACTGRIRLTAPHFSLPFVEIANGSCPVWGVGEAIGCVAPLIGEGIIPGLKSARLLMANWDEPQAYQRAILKEYSRMKDERAVVDKAVQGKRIGLFDVRALKNSTRRFRINLTHKQGLSLLRSITRVG
ncbi:MAG: hypothetical protein A2144_08825 [Chloroflexi bacterium RBG_16_50_9]|nr:MAG: hypothetical protein A2144_08825 [Chloroflexi bacterium RBG_16_50_9]